jgi:hypothetical protein
MSTNQQQMKPPMRETASQTAGPYVHIGLAPQQAGFEIFENNFGNVLTDAQTKGERIRIEGRVFDGIGTVLKDALIEIWQANDHRAVCEGWRVVAVRLPVDQELLLDIAMCRQIVVGRKKGVVVRDIPGRCSRGQRRDYRIRHLSLCSAERKREADKGNGKREQELEPTHLMSPGLLARDRCFVPSD